MWTGVDLLVSAHLLCSQGKKSKVSTSRQTQVATNTLSKAAFLLTVLTERLELHNLAFSTGMFSLELQRPPASTKALEVPYSYSAHVHKHLDHSELEH